MTPKYRLVPEEPTQAMWNELGSASKGGTWDGDFFGLRRQRALKAAIQAAPPMDYISGEEIRKFLERMRTVQDIGSAHPENNGPRQSANRATTKVWADELEKLLKGEEK